MTRRVRLLLRSAAETEALGAWLGARLRPGELLALIGELGAGKTALARGVARGLRVEDPGAVASPTYLLVVEHEGPVPMIHVDAYLAEKTRAFLADGGLAWLDERRGVAVVEWADRIAEYLPPRTLTVRLGPRPDGGEGRSAELSAEQGFDWLDGLVEAAGMGWS
ncbi:MAG: tRNA (adenosine(37)-N6)-threonylcarbamoyltransferase complex ATPase subunit type 1 TsaE [Planctomycetes bacterium]|nr:tRNA (adenosine(37)-N6)-threonylcarbamoyltransferase complex ATPase subunit type 1 TsaE [Planctomycetota bacterium]